MKTNLSRAVARVLAGAVITACADGATLAPGPQPELPARAIVSPALTIATAEAVAKMQRATARYHDLNVALAEGFVFLHGCENRPDEGPVGAVYVHFGRLTDGVVDPASPDALVYEPGEDGAKLVGVEFAMPYAMWTALEPPQLLGHTFQREDEFGVFGLHAWVWRHNPEGLFAESNPRVSCGA